MEVGVFLLKHRATRDHLAGLMAYATIPEIILF